MAEEKIPEEIISETEASQAGAGFREQLLIKLTEWNNQAAGLLKRGRLRLELRRLQVKEEGLFKEAARARESACSRAYGQWKEGTAYGPGLEEAFAASRELENRAEELRRQIQELERQLEKKREEPEEKGQEPAAVCPSCGAFYKKPVNFCRKCGTAVTAYRQPEQKAEK